MRRDITTFSRGRRLRRAFFRERHGHVAARDAEVVGAVGPVVVGAVALCGRGGEGEEGGRRGGGGPGPQGGRRRREHRRRRRPERGRRRPEGRRGAAGVAAPGEVVGVLVPRRAPGRRPGSWYTHVHAVRKVRKGTPARRSAVHSGGRLVRLPHAEDDGGVPRAGADGARALVLEGGRVQPQRAQPGGRQGRVCRVCRPGVRGARREVARLQVGRRRRRPGRPARSHRLDGRGEGAQRAHGRGV